jgi:hypothetical protein
MTKLKRRIACHQRVESSERILRICKEISHLQLSRQQVQWIHQDLHEGGREERERDRQKEEREREGGRGRGREGTEGGREEVRR